MKISTLKKSSLLAVITLVLFSSLVFANSQYLSGSFDLGHNHTHYSDTFKPTDDSAKITVVVTTPNQELNYDGYLVLHRKTFFGSKAVSDIKGFNGGSTHTYTFSDLDSSKKYFFKIGTPVDRTNALEGTYKITY